MPRIDESFDEEDRKQKEDEERQRGMRERILKESSPQAQMQQAVKQRQTLSGLLRSRFVTQPVEKIKEAAAKIKHLPEDIKALPGQLKQAPRGIVERMEGPFLTPGADPLIRQRLRDVERIMRDRSLEAIRNAAPTRLERKKGIFGEFIGMEEVPNKRD